MKKVSFLPSDTCVEREQAGTHEGLRRCGRSVGYKLCTFLNSELKQKYLNLFGFLSSVNHSLPLDVLTNVFSI